MRPSAVAALTATFFVFSGCVPLIHSTYDLSFTKPIKKVFVEIYSGRPVHELAKGIGDAMVEGAGESGIACSYAVSIPDTVSNADSIQTLAERYNPDVSLRLYIELKMVLRIPELLHVPDHGMPMKLDSIPSEIILRGTMYDVPSGSIVWQCESVTTNPGFLADDGKTVASNVLYKLRADGLFPRQK